MIEVLPRRVRYAATGLAFATSALIGGTVVVALTGSPTAGIQTNPAAADAPPVDTGTLTCTTNASSYCASQPHRLGVKPVSVVVTAQTPNSGPNIAANLDADQFTTETFRIRVFRPDGTGYANRTLTYSYAAYAALDVPPPTGTISPPTTTTTPAPTTTAPAGNSWPTPGTVGLQTTTNKTLNGGRYAEPGDFASPPWTGTGTPADPYTLSRAVITDIIRLGCACGSNALDGTWVTIEDSWLRGFTGNPTPGDSRMVQVENDGPHLTIRRSNLQPAGPLDAHGIRNDNHCADKGILAYRPFTLEDSHVSGANVLVAAELEQDETGTVVRHNELSGICSNPGDHTDIYNENGHGSNTTVQDNYLDGSRSGGTVVNNALGLYNDNIGQCDACATTRNHTIIGNRIVRYNIGILSDTNVSRTLGPWVVRDNQLDAPTVLGASPGSPYVARTPTAQSGNTVDGQPVTF